MPNNHFLYRSLRAGAALGSLLWAGSAVAGAPSAAITITFGPAIDAAAVPLLTDIGLLLLVALVAVMAFRVLRSRAAGRPLASAAALGILAAGGWATGRLESVAYADPASIALTSLVSPSDFTIPAYTAVTLRNDTGVTIQIASLTVGGGYTLTIPPSDCKGKVLSPSGTCTIRIGH